MRERRARRGGADLANPRDQVRGRAFDAGDVHVSLHCPDADVTISAPQWKPAPPPRVTARKSGEPNSAAFQPGISSLPKGRISSRAQMKIRRTMTGPKSLRPLQCSRPREVLRYSYQTTRDALRDPRLQTGRAALSIALGGAAAYAARGRAGRHVDRDGSRRGEPSPQGRPAGRARPRAGGRHRQRDHGAAAGARPALPGAALLRRRQRASGADRAGRGRGARTSSAMLADPARAEAVPFRPLRHRGAAQPLRGADARRSTAPRSPRGWCGPIPTATG